MKQEKSWVGDQSRGWKSGWRAQYETGGKEGCAEEEGAGRWEVHCTGEGAPLNWDQIAVQNICEGASILKGEAEIMIFSWVWRSWAHFPTRKPDSQAMQHYGELYN